MPYFESVILFFLLGAFAGLVRSELIALPEAKPALSIGAALSITFPFNLIVGIALHHRLAQKIHPPEA